MAIYKDENAQRVRICKKPLLSDELSLKATGLYAILTSAHTNKEWDVKKIRECCSDGRDSVLSALNELEQLGYVEKVQVQAGWELAIYESPGTSNRIVDARIIYESNLRKIEKKDYERAPLTFKKLSPNKKAKLHNLSIRFHKLQKKNWPNHIKRITSRTITTGTLELYRLIHVDGYSYSEVKKVLIFIAKDKGGFWNKNMRSLASVRKKCSDDQTKFMHCYDAYLAESDDVKDRPKPDKMVKGHKDFTKMDKELASELTSYIRQYHKQLPDRVKELFKYTGGYRRLCEHYAAWMSRQFKNFDKIVNLNLVGLDSDCWRRFIANQEKINRISFNSGRTK